MTCELAYGNTMANRIFFIFIGLALSFIGAVFIFLMGRSYLKAQETRQWAEVSAFVLESRVQEKDLGDYIATEYAPKILYGYEFNKQRYTSELVTRRGTKWSKDKKKAEKVIEQYPLNSESVCYVNQELPETAILKHDTKAAGYSIWFPALFFVGGLGVIYGACRKRNVES